MRRPDDRHSRQVLLPQVGEGGQQRLAASRVLVVGCGALGSHAADLLVRAGVGTVHLVDRDLVETSNLQRQVLYDDADARQRAPKALAAARHLSAIDPAARVVPHLVDLQRANVGGLVDRVDLVVDGTDNLETRYLLNDICVQRGLPWVYGGVIGTTGICMAVVPEVGPCLRCLFPEPAPAGSLQTCDTAGVLNTAPAVIAALQVTQAFRLLLGSGGEVAGTLIHLDLWDLSWKRLSVSREPTCRCCGQQRYEFLDGEGGSSTARLDGRERLCGRDAVQIDPATDQQVDLDELGERLTGVATVVRTTPVLEVREGGLTLVLFPDGRAVVEGTTEPAEARALYARLVGC
jgi:molybdopterin-synthase adenylyltransferase